MIRLKEHGFSGSNWGHETPVNVKAGIRSKEWCDMSSENEKFADLLFHDVMQTPQDLFVQFPPRALSDGAAVTRYAPSPTGFAHLGALYTALISRRVAHQTDGVFFLRIEDTDKEREIADGVGTLTRALEQFGLVPDEGIDADGASFGAYGPYKQSERLMLYKIFMKELVRRGRAYPCFCTPAELALARERQEQQKIRTGYYLQWAVHREITPDEAAARIAAGDPWALRLRSQGSSDNYFEIHDLAKGRLRLPENDQDAIVLKSDGYPTYHGAHVVDDTLMRVTHVIRGDEWLSSLPLHQELFDALELPLPHYVHLAPIMKTDGTGKRKLSKRKDPEANVEFFVRAGYPRDAIIEYLLNLANSGFEDWRRAHPNEPHTRFTIDLAKTNVAGALFDIIKLNDISKQVIARMSGDEVFDDALAWAEQFDESLAQRLRANETYSRAICAIERAGGSGRKDIAHWDELSRHIAYFFDGLFASAPRESLPESVAEDAEKIIQAFAVMYTGNDGRDEWLEKLRTVAAEFNFAPDTKTYKANPEAFRGHLGDIATVLRVAVTGRRATPDLFEIMQVMGPERVHGRFGAFTK